MNNGGGYQRRKLGPTSRRQRASLLDRNIACGDCSATFRELRFKLDHQRRFHQKEMMFQIAESEPALTIV